VWVDMVFMVALLLRPVPGRSLSSNSGSETTDASLNAQNPPSEGQSGKIP
jgi:hypothetical protein